DADHALADGHLDEPGAGAAVRAVARDDRADAGLRCERDCFAHRAAGDELTHPGAAVYYGGRWTGVPHPNLGPRLDRAVAQARGIVGQADDAVAVDTAQVGGDQRVGDELRIPRRQAEL